MTYENITFEIKETIALVGFGKNSKQSLPVLDVDSLKELDKIVTEIQEKENSHIKGVVFFSHNPKAFLAGADIKMIASLLTESEAISGSEMGQNLFNRIEICIKK